MKPTDHVVTLEFPTGTTDVRKSVEMAPGDRMVVKLGAAGGTGYQWELAGPAPAVMQAEGLPKQEAGESRSSGDTARVGVAAWTVYEFSALAQGRGTTRFVLRRPWEPPADAARTVDIAITVQPSAHAK